MSLSLRAIAAAAIVGVGLAGAALAQTSQAPTATEAPASAAAAAQSAPSLTELKLDLGLTPSMIARGQQLQSDMVAFGYDEDDVDEWCASKRQIRNGLIRAGFNDMDIVDRMTQFRVRVEALYLSDGWVYSMLVNRCTGDVTVLSPIYFSADLA